MTLPLNNQIEKIHEFVYECPLLVKNAVDFINKADVRQEYRKPRVQIIRPHRINLPSPRSQWRKYEWEKEKISATGGAGRADLCYGDCLLLLFQSVAGFQI